MLDFGPMRYKTGFYLSVINNGSFKEVEEALAKTLGCILNPGHGKNSIPGFQFLYTKRQIPNIIKV